ncbi:MAG: hypothetical protein QM756_00965 [Polyangiaceae bacterium]
MAVRHARRALAALLFGGFVTSPSFANGPPLVLEATPLLGSSVPDDSGWRSLRVRIENPSNLPVSGSVVVDPRNGFSSTSNELSTRLPFALAGKGHVTFEAPTHSPGAGGGAQLRVRAQDSEGAVLAESVLTGANPADAVILDLTNPSRLAPLLRNVPFTSRRGLPYARSRSSQISVAAALEDAASGDLILPEFAAGYSPATLVIGSARELARMSESEQSALGNWVLSGGALALYIDRPEDFGRPLLDALVGGRTERASAPEALRHTQVFAVATDEPDTGRTTLPTQKLVRAAPSSETAKRLVGYQGGNLHETAFGAGASYGLGELHLLAFDPRDASMLADAWTRHKLVALVEHAYEREPHAVVHHSTAWPRELSIDGIRRELDPNQATRWTIVVSALILLAYAGLAGPLNFYLAARKGQPLRALWQLPLWSFVTLSLIMLLGLFGKGVSGRARRLTLYDGGAGLSRAAAVRFRGFYAASSRELDVRASRRDHLLDLGGPGVDMSRKLTIDADGPRLTGLRTKPWQTVMVREDGFGELAGGISVTTSNGDLLVKNRSSRDLLGVVVRAANGEATYFARIRDGQSARAADGVALGNFGAAPSGSYSAAPLESGRFSGTLDHDYPGLGRAWNALEPAFAADTEWWPSDVPVVLGALDGGEGKLSDSGMAVDYDRVLVRIVGEGGLP